MIKLLAILFMAAGLLLSPFATFAQDYGSQSPQSTTAQSPPVAQTLVREGDFALKLAAELNLGSPLDENEAEEMLAKAGIAPLNGWISDYPVTPQILGQIQDSISAASSEGTLPMGEDEAKRELYDLAAQLNLPVPAEPDTATTSDIPDVQNNPAVINNYYYNQGPPIITYYAPPPSFAYLYTWVPYPAWWFGFWFPGFFITHQFTTTINIGGAIVSNRVFDPVIRRHVFIDPVLRPHSGLRPKTALRTDKGRIFRDFPDLRREFGKDPGNFAHRDFRSGGFRSPEARRNAESIFGNSLEHMKRNKFAHGKKDPGRVQRSPQAPDRFSQPPMNGNRLAKRFDAAPGRSLPHDGRQFAPKPPSSQDRFKNSRSFSKPKRPLHDSGKQFAIPNVPLQQGKQLNQPRPPMKSMNRSGRSSPHLPSSPQSRTFKAPPKGAVPNAGLSGPSARSFTGQSPGGAPSKGKAGGSTHGRGGRG